MLDVSDSNISPFLHFDYLPDAAHVRPQVARLVVGVSIATFWRIVASGELKTHKLTERTTTIKVGDLRAFIAKKSGQ